jgi:hypothetical protein
MHLFLKLFILVKHYDVSDGLSVHHKELKIAHTATGLSQTAAATCLPAGNEMEVSGNEMELKFHLVPASSRWQQLFDKCL